MADDWFRDLQRAYAANLPAHLDTLRRLASAGDDSRADLIVALHRLGGSAGSHGFMPLSDAAQAWERALRDGGRPTAALAEVEREVARSLAAMGLEPPADEAPSSSDAG